MAQRDQPDLQYRLRKARDAQQRNYSIPFQCEHTTTSLGAILTPISWQLFDVCTNAACREVVGGPYPLEGPSRSGLHVIGSTQRAGTGCAVHGCTTADGLEVHHWAPRFAFHEVCEQWPTDVLCDEHHQIWHRMMDVHARRLA